MNRLLPIAAALLALAICGMARGSYGYPNGFADLQPERNTNDLRRFDDRPFDRDSYDFRRFDDRLFDGNRDGRHYEWWFDGNDNQQFDDWWFDRNDLRYFEVGQVIA
jgi:hypothetical protein